jgi:hypothetical protein
LDYSRKTAFIRVMTPGDASLRESTTNAKARLRVVDADVHPELPPVPEWIEYIPHEWRDRVLRLGLQIPYTPFHNPHGVIRRDAYDERGRPMAENPELVRQMHMAAFGIDLGILVPTAGLATSAMSHPELSSALCTGMNDYFKDRWLNPHSCYRGSIVVSTRDIGAAVEEVERWAGDKAFVQVAIGGGQPMLLGERYFRGLREAQPAPCDSSGAGRQRHHPAAVRLLRQSLSRVAHDAGAWLSGATHESRLRGRI